MADLAKLAERVKAGAGARARLLPGEKGRARRGQPRPARRCSLSMRAGGAPACRAGHGAGGDEGRSGVPERQGLRSGWQAGEEDAVYGRPGEAPAPHWKRARGRWARGVPDGASSRWMARGRWQKAAGHGGRICRSRRWQALAEGLALIPCHPAGLSGGPRRAAEPCSLRLPGKCPPGLGTCGGWGQKKGTCIAAGAEICGGSPETRTPNQLIKSQLLYQLS